MKSHECKLQSLSDLTDDRATLTLVRKDGEMNVVVLSSGDLAFLDARIEAVRAKAAELRKAS